MDIERNIIIVGAGVSGLALALLLARAGHRISLYDKRRIFDAKTDGRSINFTISGRGLAVLSQLGLKEAVVAASAVLVGRVLHLENADEVRYQYGTQASQVLLSIRRSYLIEILFEAMLREPNITFIAGYELQDIDEKSCICHFFDSDNQSTVSVKGAFIVGADGVFSQVRNILLKRQIASYQQTVFDWGYKEYQFDQKDAEKLQLSVDHMHMWPTPNALLVAIPNTDHSFSVIFTAPLHDAEGNLRNFNTLVQQAFPEIAKTATSFLDKSGDEAHYYLVSVKVEKWHLEDSIVLIGDACHATYPFYGQGMNSALEDAVILSDYINNRTLSRVDAFIAYQANRKKDTDALHQLSEGHLEHMTKAMISSFWQACNILDYQVTKLLPKKWVYEYEMVAHSTERYGNILKRVDKQNNQKYIYGFYIIATVMAFFIEGKKFFWNLFKSKKISEEKCERLYESTVN